MGSRRPQVNGGPPFLGLQVQGGIRQDVGRDVGDVYPQAPTFRHFFQTQGVVKVPGAFPVYGHDLKVGQVLPPGGIEVRGLTLNQLPGHGQGLRGEFQGDLQPVEVQVFILLHTPSRTSRRRGPPPD